MDSGSVVVDAGKFYLVARRWDLKEDHVGVPSRILTISRLSRAIEIAEQGQLCVCEDVTG